MYGCILLSFSIHYCMLTLNMRSSTVSIVMIKIQAKFHNLLQDFRIKLLLLLLLLLKVLQPQVTIIQNVLMYKKSISPVLRAGDKSTVEITDNYYSFSTG